MLKNLKRIVCIVLTIALSAGALGTAPVSEAKTKTTVKMKAKSVDLYAMSSQAKFKEKLYFNGKSDIPYLDLEQQRKDINDGYEQGEHPGTTLKSKAKGNTVTWTKKVDGAEFRVIFNFKKNTIYFEDVDGFNRVSGLSLVGAESANESFLALLEDSGSYDRYGKSYIVNLNKYGIKLLRDKKRYYIPLQTYSDLFLAPDNLYLCYNGKCVIVNSEIDFPDDLQDIYYDVKPKKMSKAYAAFNYGELCLAMDFLFGPKETHDIKTFDQFFTENGLDAMIKNRDATQTDIALKTAINLYFDDLHCGMVMPSCFLDSDMYSKAIAMLPNGSYREKIFNLADKLAETRKEYFPNGIVPYQEVGDTAFITFDDFEVDDMQDHTVLPTDEELPNLEKDTFRLVQYAVAKITREGSPVKRVVLDLSKNEGGLILAGCYLIAAFLGKSDLTMKDVLTGAESVLRKKTDTNLDGVFDEKDTLANRGLKFYCLTSELSYSCANTVACMFKDSGKVTLIGRTTGGGSCCVQPMCTASGTILQISGTKQFSFTKNGGFYDTDRGATPDYYMDDFSKIYDRDYMVRFLDRIAA